MGSFRLMYALMGLAFWVQSLLTLGFLWIFPALAAARSDSTWWSYAVQGRPVLLALGVAWLVIVTLRIRADFAWIRKGKTPGGATPLLYWIFSAVTLVVWARLLGPLL